MPLDPHAPPNLSPLWTPWLHLRTCKKVIAGTAVGQNYSNVPQKFHIYTRTRWSFQTAV